MSEKLERAAPGRVDSIYGSQIVKIIPEEVIPYEIISQAQLTCRLSRGGHLIREYAIGGRYTSRRCVMVPSIRDPLSCVIKRCVESNVCCSDEIM